ncbi:MAG: PD-(D/E)XK nuclease family protein [Treponema sp.]|jgi:RecB family exonuclease|nr:PD-(D/E)XK nuclease family protein [Treponema sp.]
MNNIIKTLEKYIAEQRVRFVFPSDISAALWARKVCTLGMVRSVAANRFLPWDRFKEDVIREEAKNLTPVSSVMRKLFAEALVKKNAQAVSDGAKRGSEGFPFQALIPPEYAETGAVYTASLTRMLPSLAMWENLKGLSSYNPPEEDREEDRDLEVLKKEYTKFLSNYRLFEPSWERPHFKNKGYNCVIFFPEAIEDFAEYAQILEKEDSVSFVHTRETAEAGSGGFRLYRFDSCRAEIRSALLEMRRLYEEENIPWEEMAVNVPELEGLEPYLVREFSLYNIPIRLPRGRPLGQYRAGRLFSLIAKCVDSNFSFSSLKSLLLEDQLPWGDAESNRNLIIFGIKNNCVSSYREGEEMINIWDEAFKAEPGNRGLKKYYQGLKTIFCSMVESKTFEAVREHYFALRRGFLNQEEYPPENDAVLARCVEELSALVRLEKEHPDLTPPRPFAFFVSLLKEIRYVLRQEESGVSVYPYRVAAASPFKCQFILNASQQAATVLYRPLEFLRQDKRNRLGLRDYDASGDFFLLYQAGIPGGSGTGLRISSSTETLSGYSIPHNFFASCVEEAAVPAGDPFVEERSWWALGGGFPARLFPVQKEGFRYWNASIRAREKNPFIMLDSAFPAESPAAAMAGKKIREVQWIQTEGKEPMPRVSATDLNTFYQCPLLWFYGKIFEIRRFSLEAELLDDKSLGNLYHEILRNLFNRIKDEGGVFDPSRLGEYREWAAACAQEAALNYRAFEGPLAAPLVSAQARAISKKLARLLDLEKQYFPFYGVEVTEEWLETVLETEPGGVVLNGKIDRVSVSAEASPVIMDYKIRKTPGKAESTKTADKELEDFQIPFYVRLYEAVHKNSKVEGAFFISIYNNELTAVIGKPSGKKGHTREEYQETLDSLEGYIRNFTAFLKAPDFSAFEKNIKTCAGCEYKKICRTVYSLNPRGSAPGAFGEDADDE